MGISKLKDEWGYHNQNIAKDHDLEKILFALKNRLHELGENLPIPTIIGILEILKLEIIKEAEAE